MWWFCNRFKRPDAISVSWCKEKQGNFNIHQFGSATSENLGNSHLEQQLP